MPVLHRDGVNIAWTDQGEGVPILLIMGHGYSSRMWYPVFEGLGDRFRLISFDNQGTGASGARRRTSVRAMTEDARAVLDAAGVDSAHVYGVSMGGGIALEFGLRYPDRVRSLILGCTLAKTPDQPSARKWLIDILYRLPKPVLRALAAKAHNRGYGDAATPQAIARDMAMLEADSFSRKGVIAQAKAIADYSVDPEAVRAVKAPTLVLHGDQDQTVSYEDGATLAAMIPGARLVTLEGAGHNYFVAAGAQANAEVDRFITEVERAR